MKLFTKIITRLLRKIPPETSHQIAIKILKIPFLIKKNQTKTQKQLQNKIFGLNFVNPVGLAAGFDKNAQTIIAIQKIGFGFTEIGTVTPKPQKGNPKPRIFRIEKNHAIINRLGFNNHGMEIIAQRIRKQKKIAIPVGINIGPNKHTQDKIQDYAKILNYLMPIADYCCVNISSPNTAGLRKFQDKDKLEKLLGTICTIRQNLNKTSQKPILVKISPDLNYTKLKQIAFLINKYHIDGVIISNTTVNRKIIPNNVQNQAGGLSGSPLFKLATYQLARFYRLTNGKVPLIGVGGISDGKTAIRKIKAGASLIQICTALIYQGPQILNEILNAIQDEIETNNLVSIKQMIGIKAQEYEQEYEQECKSYQLEETAL